MGKDDELASTQTSAQNDNNEPFVSLYRRFRPGLFSELRGQPHVVLALQSAVRDGHVSHAYLFSGPRGTGKTSTARILAKALNCINMVNGEPCGDCMSCKEIAKGSSLDVHELDAASNNGVEAMRDLVSHAALGTPGRWKVYIVDEVHMLSNAAANALLKTLEEPPAHVVFVLATTDPQKVLPTIRSRTQHFEFRLLGTDTLDQLLRDVRDQAFLGLDDSALAVAVRRAKGSARDALSALDQVVATGSADDARPEVHELLESLCAEDAKHVLVILDELHETGWGPQQLATELIDELRQSFLGALAPKIGEATDPAQQGLTSLANRLGLPRLVRAIECIGQSQIDMRDAPDPRVVLEVALIRLSRPELDDSVGSLIDRVSKLERIILSGKLSVSPIPSQSDDPSANPTAADAYDRSSSHINSVTDPHPSTEVRGGDPEISKVLAKAQADVLAAGGSLGGSAGGSAGQSRPASTGTQPRALKDSTTPQPKDLGRIRGKLAREENEGTPQETPAFSKSNTPAKLEDIRNSNASTSPIDSLNHDQINSSELEELELVVPPDFDRLCSEWGGIILRSLPARAKALFSAGSFVAIDDTNVATFALPNTAHRDHCEEVRTLVQTALSTHFGCAIQLSLSVRESAKRTAKQANSEQINEKQRPSNNLSRDNTNERNDANKDSASSRGTLIEESDSFSSGDSFENENENGDDFDAGPDVSDNLDEDAIESIAAFRVLKAFPGAEEVSP